MSANTILCEETTFGYCFHSVNRISYGMAQSEPVKWRPLYYSSIVIRCSLALTNRMMPSVLAKVP
jgi:hypothetical protein